MNNSKINFYKEDSLKKRYLYKLGTKFIGFPIGLITAAIIPRGLGLRAYGDYNFITEFFTQLFGLANAGTSTAFYTKLSQRPEESALLRFYWVLVTIIIFIVLLFICTIFMINKQENIWIGQEPNFILLGFFWGSLYFLTQIVQKIMDAYGLTVKAELAIIKINLFGLFLLGGVFILGKFSLVNFFIYHFIIFILMLYFWWRILNRNNIPLFPSEQLSKGLINSYSSEFYQFSMPLFTYGIFSFFLGFADRWLLQMFGGSTEQGLFSLSFKVGAMCLVFTQPLTPLFHRDIYKAFKNSGLEEMRKLFLRYVPMFYSIAVCISSFFFFQSDKITVIIGGEHFKGAAVAVALMSLYPIHQTYGQLNSAVYFATGQTKLYRNLGLVNSIFGLGVIYLFLAPKSQWGLDLGSTGLALKMVFVQIISQNLMLWFNTKLLKISFIKMLSHQLISIIIIGGSGWLASLVSNNIVNNMILSLLIFVLIYVVLLIGILYFLPSLFSTTHSEIIQNIRFLKQRLFSS